MTAKAHQPRATLTLRCKAAAMRADGMSDAEIANELRLPVEAIAEYADASPRTDNGEVRVEIDSFTDVTATAKRIREPRP
jgi:hypothetical protein